MCLEKKYLEVGLTKEVSRPGEGRERSASCRGKHLYWYGCLSNIVISNINFFLFVPPRMESFSLYCYSIALIDPFTYFWFLVWLILSALFHIRFVKKDLLVFWNSDYSSCSLLCVNLNSFFYEVKHDGFGLFFQISRLLCYELLGWC